MSLALGIGCKSARTEVTRIRGRCSGGPTRSCATRKRWRMFSRSAWAPLAEKLSRAGNQLGSAPEASRSSAKERASVSVEQITTRGSWVRAKRPARHRAWALPHRPPAWTFSSPAMAASRLSKGARPSRASTPSGARCCDWSILVTASVYAKSCRPRGQQVLGQWGVPSGGDWGKVRVRRQFCPATRFSLLRAHA